MNFNKFHSFNIEFIIITQESLPNSTTGLFFFFLFKFIGLIVFSNSFELLDNNSSNVSVCNLFRTITYFGSMKRSNLTLVNYELSCILIYILLLIPVIIYLILFCKCPSLSSNYSLNYSNKKVAQIAFTSTYKIISSIIVILAIVYIFFSQHLVEYFIFPIMTLLPNNYFNDPELAFKIETIKLGMNINPIVILSINVFFVLLLNLYIWFFFKYYNRPVLSRRFVYKFAFNDFFLYLLMITFNFQGFHFLIHLGNISKYVFTLLTLVLSIVLVLFSLSRFIERTNYNYILLSYIYFAIYSCILSLIMFLSKNTNEEFLNEIFLEKFIIEIIFVFVTHYVLLTLQDGRLNKAIRENILIKTKNMKGDYLFQLADILKQCMYNNKKFSLLFDLLETNQNKITKSNVNGKDRLNLSSYFEKLKDEQKFNLSSERRHILFKDKYNNLLVLIESEIISHIFNLFCSKKIRKEIRIPLLHCDFISYFKLNYSLSLFLIQEYLAKIPRLSFESIIYFYSLKQLILNEREKRLKQNQNNNSLHVKFGNFISYFHIIQDIKSHLIKNCSNYQQIILLKNIYSEMKSNRESKQFKADLEVLFENCMKIEKSMHEMEETIIEHFSNNTLKNPEMVFLITTFYEITQKQVPSHIKENMINITSYEDISKFDSSFSDQGFDHPIILTLSSSNSFDFSNVKMKSNFIIYYVSQKLMNGLGYKESELIGKDYHILLPRMFAEAHSIELKKVFFINENFQINNTQFILSKEGYYIRIRETSDMIPTLKNETFVIVNIALDPIDNNHFLFITDINSNIITMTKNFESTFQLNCKMIKQLGITFSGLFNINNEKLLSDFNNKIKSINKINIDSIDSLMTVMSNNTYENVLSAYQAKENKDNVLTIRLNQKKKKLCFCLQKVRKQIEEQEYDTDWVLRIATFEKLCSLDKYESSFDIVITLKNAGNIPYFFIKVHEKDSMNLNEQTTTNLSSLNKMNCFNDFNQEEYSRKYNESYRKSSFNQSFQRKSQKTRDSITHNSSISMNETNHQLLSMNKQVNSSKTPFNSKSLIEKLKMHSDKTIQKNNELIATLKQRENFCTIILFILMIGMTVCFIANFFSKNTGIKVIKDSSNLIFNIVKLKEAVLESAILVSSGCYQLDDLEPNPYDNVDFTPEMIKSQLYVRGSEMFKFYNEYNEYLKSYSHIKEINHQLSTLQSEFSVSSMNIDFATQTYETSFEIELNSFHFHCGYMKTRDSLITCNIRYHFLGKITNNNNAIASEDEIFFYYTSYNIIIGFMNTIDKLINQSSVFLFNKANEISQQFLYFNVSILITALSVLFSFIFIIVIYKQRIVSYLKVFIVKSEKTKIIEKRLNNFRTILLSFDNEVCELYEINMNKLNTNERNNDKKITPINGKVKHKERHNSNSITKSSKNHQKKTKEDDYYQEEHFDANTMKIFSLKILRKALLLFFISLFTSMGVIIGNLVIDTSLFHNVLLSCETAFSYMDHTASLNELLLYYRVSILYRDANLIKLHLNDFNSMMYEYRLTSTTVNINDDERYSLLGESKMAFLYYRSLFESGVISYFESANNMQILPLLKQYNKLIDTDGIACEQFFSAYTKYVNNYKDSFDQDLLLHACMSLEGGNSNQGINKQMEHFFTAVFDQYMDFVKNPEGDLVAYSKAPAFVSCIKLMTFVYNVNWHIFVKIIEQELKDLFSNVSFIEIIFQIIELIMNILFFALYSSFIFGYLKLSIDRYGTIIERLKITLN